MNTEKISLHSNGYYGQREEENTTGPDIVPIVFVYVLIPALFFCCCLSSSLYRCWLILRNEAGTPAETERETRPQGSLPEKSTLRTPRETVLVLAPDGEVDIGIKIPSLKLQTHSKER